jgi:hypothetical protein
VFFFPTLHIRFFLCFPNSLHEPFIELLHVGISVDEERLYGCLDVLVTKLHGLKQPVCEYQFCMLSCIFNQPSYQMLGF